MAKLIYQTSLSPTLTAIFIDSMIPLLYIDWDGNR